MKVFQLVEKTKKELVKELIKLKKMGENVSGIGASTKGNVILQYCELDDLLLSEIAGGVNKRKIWPQNSRIMDSNSLRGRSIK